MSYGNQSNAPWQRNVMQGHPQQSGGFHQGTQMFMQNAQQNMAAFGHGGMQAAGSGNMFPGGGAGGGGNTVSYPQPRSGLNPVAFQQGGGGGGGPSHYNSIGTVTKMSNDCGLVNDEVFFYRNVCKGPEPKLGDRVIFEATYSNNGQFKWNATRVQLMQQPQPLMGSNKSNYSSVAPPNEYQRGQMRRNSPKRSPIRGRHERDHRERDRLHRSRDRDETEHERKRRREDNERSRDRGNAATNRGGAAAVESRSNHGARNEKDRNRGESRKKEREAADREREDRERERERERARDLEVHRAGAKGRRAVAIKRYKVQIPKSLLTIKTADVQDLRNRYTNLYIPSDYFHSNIKWSETFTPDNPFSLRRPCQFHIMHEIVEPPTQPDPELLEPSDANYLYSAKVMLMSLPPIAEIYKKCFEYDDNDGDHHAMHPSRLINFLVGVKSRGGPMAIGGPWSPSLDGENPDTDPSVLIRTAIRTCKALSGIDLSNCTQWYRFVELYYHRTEYKNMEKDGPPRVETVVIYLPDVHSCMPSIEEWQTLTQVYKTAADDVIARRAALVAAATAANVSEDNDKTNDVEMADDSTLADDSAMEAGDENPDKDENAAQNNDEEDGEEEHAGEEASEEKMDDSTASADVSGVPAAADNDDDVTIVEADDGEDVDESAVAEAADENDEPAPEPTHYSLLDLKSMKVQEIRDELLARNLPDKGVRNVVMARLAKALNTEKAEEHKNKRKNKYEQSSPQKTNPAKKLNESNTKNKKDEEKMEVDSENISKAGDKKQSSEANKKKPEKKGSEVKASEGKAKDKQTTDKKNVAKGKNGKEDPEDWADIIDFELSDIVILDEYDSSKNPEENNLKEMSEKEKSQLIRRYTLPSAPHVVVHPNRQAKGGKFDCAVMSLSVLLDYHPDDTKERFFEVSLFAELFNDMLMRDFAFNIYKEIYLYEETPATGNSCEITEIKAEGDVKKEKTETADEVKKENNTDKEVKKECKEKEDEKEKSTKKDSKSNSEDKSSNKDHHTDDSQSIKSESRKRKISTSTSTANGKERELSVSDKKMVVVKPLLLLSFVYFDTTHCGYIFEKDLEELFSVLGLNLSRSQIKKVLGKLATRQAIYYRKLTDKEETQEAPPAIEDVDDLPTEELLHIAAGNNQYENIFGRKDICKQATAVDGDESKDGLINFNGTVVHVGKLLNQINRTEKNYSDLEKLYNDLLKQHTDLQKEHNKSTSKVKDLQSEVKSVSRKLTDANQDFYSLNRKYRDQNSTLSYIYTRVAPYFSREKDKDKDAKTEGTRDKDKDEKDKSKEKDSEKVKETSKDDKEKDSQKDDKEKEKSKDDKDDKEKVKDDKEKVKDVKEKESQKDEKEKDPKKDDKEKEKAETKKDENEKEKPKEEKEKPKDNKVEKPITKTDKVKSTPQKNTSDKSTKPTTPVVKKQTDSKPAGKVVKKSDTVSAKK